jgi:hypothetical protein
VCNVNSITDLSKYSKGLKENIFVKIPLFLEIKRIRGINKTPINPL